MNAKHEKLFEEAEFLGVFAESSLEQLESLFDAIATAETPHAKTSLAHIGQYLTAVWGSDAKSLLHDVRQREDKP